MNTLFIVYLFGVLVHVAFAVRSRLQWSGSVPVSDYLRSAAVCLLWPLAAAWCLLIGYRECML